MRQSRYKEPTGEDIVDRQFLITNQRGNVVVNDDGEPLVGEVIDELSIVKRNLGKVTYGAELSAGVEQLLYPEIGIAVEHTGNFWRDPYRRVAVSMGPIMAVVYAANSYTAGDFVQSLHRGVNGTDTNGRSFNTLNPDAFFWAHETFRSGVEKTAEHYSRRPFTDGDREQLQLESTTWYSYYGMPMNMVPADYQANLAYRRHIIDDVMEMNPSAERAIDAAMNHHPPRPQYVPESVWKIAKVAMTPVTEIVGIVTIGELDPAIRDKFGIPWSTSDQRKLDEIHTISKGFIDPLPDPLRYSAQAYESLLRDRGEHKNVRDKVVHRGLEVGKKSVRATVAPILKLVA